LLCHHLHVCLLLLLHVASVVCAQLHQHRQNQVLCWLHPL
jgi:hypothetical protein